MPDRSLAEWLTLIESRHPSEIELGLGRVAEVWHRLLQQPRLNQCKPPLAITVAGTNGKGSTCAMLDSILRQAGYRAGLYLPWKSGSKGPKPFRSAGVKG